MKEVLFLTTHLSDFYIREDGAVLRVDSQGKREVPQSTNRDRFKYVRLMVAVGKKQNFFIHRVVAQAFIPNPLGLPEVNHIDRVRSNCHKDNLEWVTTQQNVVHAYESSQKKSRYYGVHWNDRSSQNKASHWKCSVTVDGKRKYVKSSQSEIEVARAYDQFVTLHKLGLPLNKV